MKLTIRTALMALVLVLSSQPASADAYSETLKLFQNAGESGTYFQNCFAYAVFPNVAKAGLGVGGARGRGRVYANGKPVGDVTLTQLSVGLQAGARAYSEMIFFEDKRALDEFSSGNFEFDASIGVVAITAGASASAGSSGANAAASGGKKDAATIGQYRRGMVVFVIAKGGLMYEASVAGQKFRYTKR